MVAQPSTDVIVSEGANINVTNGDSAISLESDNIQDFINKGNVSINADQKGSSSTVGVSLLSTDIRNFTNETNRTIESKSNTSVAVGISIESNVTGTFWNKGTISAESISNVAYGVSIDPYGVEKFINNGVIYAMGNLANSVSSAVHIGGGSDIADFQNTGNLLYKGKNGSQLSVSYGNVNITHWGVKIGALNTFDDLSSLANGNTTDGQKNNRPDKIVLGGDEYGKLTGITFGNQAIKISVGNDFQINKSYDLKNIVVKNEGGIISPAYDELKLNASNFVDGNKNDIADITFANSSFTGKKPSQPESGGGQGGGGGDSSGGGVQPPVPPKPEGGGGQVPPQPDPQKPGGGDSSGGDKPKPESGEVSAVVKVNTKKALSNTVNKGIVTSDAQKTTYIDGVISNAIDGALNRGQFKVTNNDYFNLESKNRYASVESDAIVYDEVKGANAMKHYTYLIPYANHTKVNTDFGDNKSDAFGLVGGYQQDLGNSGVLGFYLGYQRDDVDGVLGLTYTNDTFLLGINHYKTLSQKGNLELYTKAIVSMDFSTMDLERKDSENTKIDKANTNNFGFGGTFALGGNYYLDNMGSIDTSAFVGYKRMNLGSYSIGQEHYHKTNMNLFTAGANIEWFKQFDNHIFVSTQGGVRFNLNRDIETNITIYNNNITGKNKLPSTFGHIQGEIGYAFNESLSTSITYNYQVAKDTQSHTGNVKVGYRW